MSNAIVLELIAGTIVGVGAAALVLAVGSAGVQQLISLRQDMSILKPQASDEQSATQVVCMGVDAVNSPARSTSNAAIGAHASND